MKIKSAFFLAVFLFTSCSNQEKSLNHPEDLNPAVPNDYFIYSILYNYFTAEYKALCYQAFNAAADQLELIKLKSPKKKNLAIVMDIDETLLDNSPYQAKLFEINSSYDTLWNEWSNMAVARAVPGSKDFLLFADSLGFTIFYITNRKLKKEYYGTLENMDKAGFPQVDSLHFFMRTDASNKESRRNKVEENFEVVMLVGDNISDFYEDTPDYPARDSMVKMHKSEFGRRFVVIPNAIYGNWVESLGIKSKKDVDSLISIMASPFNKR